MQVLELKELPSVVTLIGGGYIGMEFAGMFARLGCEVHVVARQALPLAPRFDKEVRVPWNPAGQKPWWRWLLKQWRSSGTEAVAGNNLLNSTQFVHPNGGGLPP